MTFVFVLYFVTNTILTNFQMFVVVSTTKGDDTLFQAVSTSFIVDGVYFYPKQKKHALKAIVERHVPNDQEYYVVPEFKIESKTYG